MNTNMRLRRVPIRYSWIGGRRAGYALYDYVGVEICRVWAEADAKLTVYCGYARPESLVDEVIKRRWP